MLLLEKKVLNYIKENSMIQEGDKVLIALSGGPDSVCLLNIMNNLKKELNITLFAAHINHCLRGKEADEDEAYVKEICNRLGIECYVKRADINRIAKERGVSSEMAGREVRYSFFEELREKLGIQKIALAHNANDQTETILMRLMRGTGIEGLIGIRPVRDEAFIRPILVLERFEIENYCLVNKLNPRIDKTNLETIYTRNKIRLELIPYIQKNFNEDITNTLNRLSQLVAKDNEYLECVSLQKFNKYCKYYMKKELIISKEAFEEHEAVLSRIIRIALNKFFGSLYNLEKIHIYDIITLQKQGTGKVINLPGGIIVENRYEDIVIRNSLDLISSKKEIYYNIRKEELSEEVLKKGMQIQLEDFKASLSIRLIKDKNNINFNSNPLVKYFDYDKIKEGIIIRNRKDGDKFIPYGMKGNKKLKDLFMDLKIPKFERDSIPLVCFGNDIGWIVGYRVGELFKVDINTKNVLEINFEREVNRE